MRGILQRVEEFVRAPRGGLRAHQRGKRIHHALTQLLPRQGTRVLFILKVSIGSVLGQGPARPPRLENYTDVVVQHLFREQPRHCLFDLSVYSPAVCDLHEGDERLPEPAEHAAHVEHFAQ